MRIITAPRPTYLIENPHHTGAFRLLGQDGQMEILPFGPPGDHREVQIATDAGGLHLTCTEWHALRARIDALYNELP